jgi:hypothetical protein
MSFSIGQIVYIAPNSNKQKIIPALVQEETRSRTLNGESVTYKVLIGPPNSPKSKIVSTSQISGKIFASLEELKEVVIKDVVSFIEEKCAEAEELANRLYGNLEYSTSNNSVSKDGKIDPTIIFDEIDSFPTQQIQGTPKKQTVNNGNQSVPVNMHNSNGQPVSYQEIRQRIMEKMMDDTNMQLIQTDNETIKDNQVQNKK